MTAIRSVDSLKYGAGLFAYLFVALVAGGGLVGLGLELGYSAATDLVGGAGLGAVDTTDLAAGGVLAFLGSFVVLTGVFGLAYKLLADGVAAGVAAGAEGAERVPSGAESRIAPAESVETDERGESPAPRQTGPSPGEQSARRHGVSTTVPAAADAGQENRQEAVPGDAGSQPVEQTAETAGEPSLGEMFDESGGGERVEPAERSRQRETDEETTFDFEPKAPEASVDEPGETDEETAGGEKPPREPTPEEIAFGTASEDDTTEATDGPSTATDTTSGTDPLAEPDDE
jgi:hypothetical protein